MGSLLDLQVVQDGVAPGMKVQIAGHLHMRSFRSWRFCAGPCLGIAQGKEVTPDCSGLCLKAGQRKIRYGNFIKLGSCQMKGSPATSPACWPSPVWQSSPSRPATSPF